MELLRIHNFRQDYLLGHISSGASVESFVKFLSEQGFEIARIAWKDPGEIVGMRKLDQSLYQYHIRLFEDREIRGHYEYAPEAKPIDHCLEREMESKTDFFENLLKDYLVKK